MFIHSFDALRDNLRRDETTERPFTQLLMIANKCLLYLLQVCEAPERPGGSGSPQGLPGRLHGAQKVSRALPTAG